MLKNTLKTLFILILGATLNSCQSDISATRLHAQKLCDCMEEIGIDESLTAADLNDRRKMREMERKVENTMPTCFLPTMKAIEADMEEMGKTEKTEYTKAFLKNVIDTDCADAILQNLPFDMIGLIVKEMEREVEYSKRMDTEVASDEIEQLTESVRPD